MGEISTFRTSGLNECIGGTSVVKWFSGRRRRLRPAVRLVRGRPADVLGLAARRLERPRLAAVLMRTTTATRRRVRHSGGTADKWRSSSADNAPPIPTKDKMWSKMSIFSSTIVTQQNNGSASPLSHCYFWVLQEYRLQKTPVARCLGKVNVYHFCFLTCEVPN